MLTKTESCFKNSVTRSYLDTLVPSVSDIMLDHAVDDFDTRLLPDSSWIAIVCGVSKWGADEKPPDRFFVAPKYVYMPDLTAVADVLLGKLVRYVNLIVFLAYDLSKGIWDSFGMR
jgi:L-arabinokinase